MTNYEAIPFNLPAITGGEAANIDRVLNSNKCGGDGPYSKQCEKLLEASIGSKRALLTPSGTAALELAALLLDLQAGDEVLMPSYTFVSTASAFVLRGAVPVFVDVRPDTMNIDETKLEAALTPKTRGIVVVHYAGVGCEMDSIMAFAEQHGLWVVEDAAQAAGAYYKGRPLGSIGHLAALSFHETKNIHCGEGGALLINDEAFVERGEIVREKGTNRSRFLRGQIDKYTWVDIGSSYLLSELNSAFLLTQLENLEAITQKRLSIWLSYSEALGGLAQLDPMMPPAECGHNGHMYFIKLRDIGERQVLIDKLKALGIQTAFHYIPLHSAPYGAKVGRFAGPDLYTTADSERLLRLPLFYQMTEQQVARVIDGVSGAL